MENSILRSTKKMLGIDDSYTVFDLDILFHINTVFSTLDQLGVGPEGGFMIEDATATWTSFLGSDPRRNSIKTYIYLKVRMLFDPPQTSYLIDSLKEQAKELEWRINAYRETYAWTAPVDPDDPLTIIDGGDADPLPIDPVVDGGEP